MRPAGGMLPSLQRFPRRHGRSHHRRRRDRAARAPDAREPGPASRNGRDRSAVRRHRRVLRPVRLPDGAVGQHHHRRLQEGAEALLRLRGPGDQARRRQSHGAQAAGGRAPVLRRSGGDARTHRDDAGRSDRVRAAPGPADLRRRGPDVPALDHPGWRQPVAQGEDRARGLSRAAQRVGRSRAGSRMMAPGPEPEDAPPITRAQNRALLDVLPFRDTQDFEDARRGFLATLPEVVIRNERGRVVWNLAEYAFLEEAEAPPTVNPSLWRQARLNMHHGLFQVTDRIYQIRGFDISNMTIIEGERGLIVIDPLLSPEVARAGLDLYIAHRGRRPVTAVIYTHSHTDHYGGVRGVVDEADVKSGAVEFIAPAGFMEEIVSENVLAGTPMIRRAQFQFGATLPKGPRGQVDAGLGKVTSRGTVTLIPPTRFITAPIETYRIDGVEIVFQLAPETEAPAEMHMFYPALRALNLAENATHNLHNTYPIRGAQVRDANAWARYLNEALDRFGPGADVVLAQHHWPIWANHRVLAFLAKQRDLSKYLHDQTVRLMNHGWKAAEIAERLTLPRSLSRTWHVRGYYGTMSHNSKAVYQRYLGWDDPHPANNS